MALMVVAVVVAVAVKSSIIYLPTYNTDSYVARFQFVVFSRLLADWLMFDLREEGRRGEKFKKNIVFQNIPI